MAETAGADVNFLVDIVVPIGASLIAAGAAYLATLRQIQFLRDDVQTRQTSALESLKRDLSDLYELLDRVFVDLSDDIQDNGKDLTWVSAVITQEPHTFSEAKDWRGSVSEDQYSAIQNVRVALGDVRYDVPVFLRGDKSPDSRRALVDKFQQCLNTIHSAMDLYGVEVP